MANETLSVGVVMDPIESITPYKDSSLAMLLEAERREVAVLFSDVAGYTSLSNRLPPADIMRSLRLYLDAMVPIVQKHGGYLDKINGDGLMVLFGAPRSIGDHSQAAVACAIETPAGSEMAAKVAGGTAVGSEPFAWRRRNQT